MRRYFLKMHNSNDSVMTIGGTKKKDESAGKVVQGACTVPNFLSLEGDEEHVHAR